jgi:hypothetical protein
MRLLSMDCISKWLLLFLLLVLPFTLSFSQQERPAIIAGEVNDAESGASLEDAIVFLSNTPLGTSTGKEGKFILRNIPVGEYELVVSRVGYERQTLSIKLEEPESLYYKIKLKPEPVKTKGIDVVGERAEGARQALGLFFPHEGDNAYCIYGTVSSLPIGVLFIDSAIYMYSLDTAVVDSAKYIRLWLLFKNLSKTRYDFNPKEIIKLYIKGKSYSAKEIPPDMPTAIFPLIDTQRIISRISETVGTSLKALATKQTVFEWEQYHSNLLFTMGPRPAILRPSSFNPAREGSLSSILYDIFTNSVNVGILQRYTVYPDNSLNGFVYFPFPGLDWKASGSWFREAAEYVYELELRLPSGTEKITFIPN